MSEQLYRYRNPQPNDRTYRRTDVVDGFGNIAHISNTGFGKFIHPDLLEPVPKLVTEFYTIIVDSPWAAGIVAVETLDDVKEWMSIYPDRRPDRVLHTKLYAPKARLWETIDVTRQVLR